LAVAIAVGFISFTTRNLTIALIAGLILEYSYNFFKQTNKNRFH